MDAVNVSFCQRCFLVCGHVCGGSGDKLCFSLIQFDTDWFAERVEAFDEPLDIFQ